MALQGCSEVCVTVASSPRLAHHSAPKGLAEMASGGWRCSGRALSPRGRVCTDLLDNSRTDS